jgi:hypothetical protein
MSAYERVYNIDASVAAAKFVTCIFEGDGSLMPPQARNEQMYSQRPLLTAIVKPLLAGTSKCVPAAYL